MFAKKTTALGIALIGVSATSVLAFSESAMAAAIGVDWTTPTTGNLDGISVNLSNK